MDVLGKALAAYWEKKSSSDLLVHASIAETETLHPEYFFRSFPEMPELEQHALNLALEPVLDIGCGAGSHSLYLQNLGLTVTGIDCSAAAIAVAADRGVTQTVCEDIWKFNTGNFRTLLLLMNGAGLAGTLENLPRFLKKLSNLMTSDGQILLDSSDLIYLFETDEDGGIWVPGDTNYYGEITYQWEYNGEKGPEFPWLFVDFENLKKAAATAGLKAEVLKFGPHYDYLARLIRQ
ncbi:MAG: hypothetical protein RLZZ241_459 [Bacteroidota bacterium]|jgi:SAM-dependent methyltransferase